MSQGQHGLREDSTLKATHRCFQSLYLLIHE